MTAPAPIALLRRSFFWKVFGGYAALVAVSASVIGALVLGSLQHNALTDLDASLLGTARLIASMEAANPEHLWSDRLPRHIREVASDTGFHLTLVFANGTVAATSDSEPTGLSQTELLNLPEFARARAHGHGTDDRALVGNGPLNRLLVAPIILDYEVIGYIRVGLPLSRLEHRLETLRNRVIAGATVNALLALGLGFFFARHTTRPLTEIRDVCERIATGHFDRRIHLRRQDEFGVVAHTINRMADDVERRIANETRERQRLATLLAGMTDGVVAINAQGVISYQNDVAARILGFDPRRADGQPVDTQFRLGPALDLYHTARAGDQRIVRELRITGHPHDLVLRADATPLRDPEGAPFGIVLVLHDLSEIRRLEDLRRTFTANVSHELKTPLTAIGSLLDVLLGDEQLDPATRHRFLDKIRHQSDRLTRLVGDLLVIARLESEQSPLTLRELDAAPVARECVQTFGEVARQKGVALHIVGGDEPIRLHAHEESLRLILNNLLHNAIAHTPAGGLVTLTLATAGGSMTFVVRDTGVGIGSEHVERIFERFYRVDRSRDRSAGGTGLGLSIVKHLTQALGGHVLVESRVNEGSLFTVRIPISPP